MTDTIKYTPYLGELEPITEVIAAEVKLYPKHLELIRSYRYDPYLPDADACGYVKAAVCIPRNQLAVELTESWHEKDVKKSAYPTVRVYYANEYDLIHVQTEKEAYDIYSRIKKWMLNE